MTEAGRPERGGGQVRQRRFRPGLAGQVLIGLVLGLATGIFFGEKAASIKIVGDAFVMLMQVAVLPYIVASLIVALGRLSVQDAKNLGLNGGAVLLVFWAIGAVVLILSPLAFPDWPSASFFSTSLIEETKPVDFLGLYIPANPFASMANGVVPAIVVFSALVGIALIGVDKKEVLLAPLSAAADALVRVIGFIGRLAPVGVFALIASAAGTLDLEEFEHLQVYLILYVALAAILSFWMLPGFVALVTPLRYSDILRSLHSVLITGFAAGSVLIVLPLMAAECRRLVVEATRAAPEKPQESDQACASVDVLIPAAYNIPSLGSMISLLFVIFAGWYIGSALPLSDYPLVIGGGLASLFAGPILAIPFLLDLLRLPQDLFQLFVTLDVLGSRLGTLVAIMTIAAIALVGAIALAGQVRIRILPLLRFAVVAGALMACALIGIRAFYSYVVVAPYTKDEALQDLDFLADPQPATVYREIPPEIKATASGPAGIEQIQARSLLRACYLDDNFPYSFFNADGQLVGFDIELVHRLAKRLGVSIEFLPVQGEGKASAARLLKAGVCDLYGSLMPITARRVAAFTMTVPVYTSSVGFLVPDHRRHDFETWSAIRAKGPDMRIALPDNPEAIQFVSSMLPEARLVPLASLAEQQRILESDSTKIDAIGNLSEGGAAWALLYPSFHLVVPRPVVFTQQGIGVAPRNQSLVQVLDAWIISEKGLGTVDTLYRYWLLGEAAKREKPPRWSVLRNVLGWGD